MTPLLRDGIVVDIIKKNLQRFGSARPSFPSRIEINSSCQFYVGLHNFC